MTTVTECKVKKTLFFVAFAGFCPKARHAETPVKKEENGENDFYFPGKVLKPRTYKHIYAQNKVKQDDKPGEILCKFLHGGYR
jgi:hypothetical protein